MALGGLWTRVTGLMFGIGIGRTAGAATEPVFELVRQEAWKGNANRVLSLNQLANLVAMGVLEFDSAVEQAAREGFDSNRLRAMVEYYLNPIQYGYAFTALQRGTITEEQFRHVLQKQGIEPQYHDAMVELQHVLPSVTDLVRFGVREVFNPSQREFLDLDAEFPPGLAAAGEKIGLQEQTTRDYWAAHWELPSYTQLAQMRFRGLLSPEQFRNALKAADYAPTWRDKLETIARAIPTMTDFIRFAQREVFSPAQRAALDLDEDYPDEFTAKAALHGMAEQDARDYWAAHWRLPSARQGYQMVWRKEMGEDELKGLLKALDYPKKWRDRLFNIAYLRPGRIDLKRMFRFGILTRQQVKLGYEAIGYHPTDAELMTQIAEAEMQSGEAGMPWLNKANNRLFTVCHNEYIAGSVDEAVARGVLSSLNIPEGEQTLVLAAWDEETQISRLELTPAQIKKAYAAGRYTYAEAVAELQERGMTTDDAEDFLQS